MRILLILGALILSAGLAAQEIDVERNGSSVPSGGSVDLGTVDVLENAEVNFTIQNEGLVDLHITGGVAITDTDHCTADVQQPGDTTIAPGASTTFQVHVQNDGDGSFSCDISIPNDDADESPYTIMITGVAVANDKDKDKHHDNCSTSEGTGSGLILFGIATTGLVAWRLRRRRAA